MCDYTTTGTQLKKIANKIIWLEKRIKANGEVMHQAIKILPIESTTDLNFTNYFLKIGAYPFIMDQAMRDELHNIFKIGFEAGRQKYPDEDDELHHALIVNGKVYLGYKGYGIHTGTNGIKLARSL